MIERPTYLPTIALGHSFNNYPPSGTVLRAQLNERTIGQLATPQGDFEVTELDIPGLEPESRENLASMMEQLEKTRKQRLKKAKRELGTKAVKDIIIASPLTVLAAASDGFQSYGEETGVALGYPALIQREAFTGQIQGARGIHIPIPGGKAPHLNPQALDQARENFLNQRWPLINQSQDRELHRRGQPSPPIEPPTEPLYNWTIAGNLPAPDKTNVHNAWLESIARPPVPGRATIVHSRSAIALAQQGMHPESYAQVFMARDMQRSAEGQQTQEFDRLAYFSAATLQRFIEHTRSH